jgi:hypothetical protein
MNGWLSVAIIIVAQIPSSMSGKTDVSCVFKRRAQRSCEFFFGRCFPARRQCKGAAHGIDPVAHLSPAPAPTGLGNQLQALRVPTLGPAMPLSFECHADEPNGRICVRHDVLINLPR